MPALSLSRGPRRVAGREGQNRAQELWAQGLLWGPHHSGPRAQVRVAPMEPVMSAGATTTCRTSGHLLQWGTAPSFHRGSGRGLVELGAGHGDSACSLGEALCPTDSPAPTERLLPLSHSAPYLRIRGNNEWGVVWSYLILFLRLRDGGECK